jgi:hypothetical protein
MFILDKLDRRDLVGWEMRGNLRCLGVGSVFFFGTQSLE